LSGFGLRDTTQAPADQSASMPIVVSLPPPAPLDFAKLAEITDGDQEFTRELLNTFFASAAQSLDEMNQMLVAQDRQQLARAAHKLKGAAANIHALEVARVASEVEHSAADGTTDALATSISQLRVLVDQVMRFVEHTGSGSTQAA